MNGKKNQKNTDTKKLTYAAVIAAAFLSFVSIYGAQILNPSYYEWMFGNGDTIQHIIGAEGFRKSPWFFPIGNMNTLNYPNNVSVIFYDCIPLLAIIVKISSAFLPHHFQYFGIWGLICFILQGIISAKIIRNYTKNFWIVLISSVLLIHSPIMIYRIYNHEALGAQWLILLSALLLAEYKQKYANLNAAIKLVCLLGFLTPAIHLYFVLLCGIVIAGYCLYDWLETKKITRTILILAVYIFNVAAVTFLLGGFSMNAIGSEGFGLFSFNLNSLINSMDCSEFVKSLPMNLGQTEGFSYLGIGQLGLIITITLFFFFEYKGEKHINRKLLLTYGIISLICIVLSVSNIITIGTKTLFTIPLPRAIVKVLSTFRSTGRIIWPFYYLLILYAIITGIKILKPKTIFSFLLVCFLIQRVELNPLYSKNKDNQTHESSLQTETWKNIMDNANFKNIVILGKSYGTKGPFYRFGILAFENNLTMNRFRMVHDDLDEAFDYYTQADLDIRNNTKENLYIFLDDFETISFPELNYYVLDNYVIGLPDKDNQNIIPEMTKKAFDIPFYRFSFNKGENLNGVPCIYKGGELIGPKQILRKGKYLFTINGNDLELCKFSFNSVKESPDTIHYEVTNTDNVRVQIQAELDKDLNDFEIRIYNSVSELVQIGSITIEALE